MLHRSLRLALVLVLATAAGAQAKAELAPARELLDSRAEADVHKGSAICVKANNVPAVEMLLEVIEQTERRSRNHLAPGHYRDIVWDGLLKITDPYARRRVEFELKNGKDPHVREWCAELLGSYGDKSFGDSLRQALGSKDEDIVRQAARALGLLKFEPAASQLQTLVHHRDDCVRANAIEALACIDARHVAGLTAAIAEDPSGGVRCALLGAAPKLCGDDTESVSAKALRDADWRPRMQAVENLGKVRSKGAVDALVGALRDGRPVVAARALRELQELTGQPIQQAAMWEGWWKDNRATFAFPEQRGVAKREAGTVAYHGVPVDSDHVAFLIDKSVMMQARLQSKNATKEEAAQAELAKVLQQLDDKITFNVLCYDTEVRSFAKKAVKLTDKSREKAIDFAREKSAGREKDIWQALATVVDDPTLDTAYLLSSGEPDTGLYVHWNRVTRHLADLNRFHKLTVHSIAFTDSEWFRDQIQKIAEVTGGHFEWLK